MGGTVGVVGPEPQEHGSLEDEAIPQLAQTQAVQKAVEGVCGEQAVVVVAGGLCLIEQARGDGEGLTRKVLRFVLSASDRAIGTAAETRSYQGTALQTRV